MSYDFKKAQEAAWAFGVAVALVLLQTLVTLDFETIIDWRAWAIGLLGGAVRAGAAAALAVVGRREA